MDLSNKFKKNILKIIRFVDSIVGELYVSMIGEKPGLIGFLFHGTFKNREEISRNLVDPQQQITLDDFREFVAYYLKHGYKFISPDDLIGGLNEGKYAMITFDDGYYNNISVLPILNEFKVPAIFFIATSNIKEQKGFWWDVLYREGKRLGWTNQKISQERRQLKNKKYNEITKYISDTFGPDAENPVGNGDRPFNAEELRAFSKNPYVYIGNHTRNHAILTNYSYNEIVDELRGAQEDLIEMTGRAPKIVAYPNGRYSADVVSAVKKVGFALGTIVDQKKNYFPIKKFGNSAFLIDRFILWGNRNIKKQCLDFRYDGQLSMERWMKKILKN